MNGQRDQIVGALIGVPIEGTSMDRVQIGGITLMTHAADRCQGPRCPIHHPSDHHMRQWPANWRHDRRIIERVCEHGIGHPDPDDPTQDRTHGCDGCCAAPKQP